MKQLFLMFMFWLVSGGAFAWNREISIGYGDFQEFYKDYNNYGYFVKGMFHKEQLDKTLILGANLTAASINATTETNKHLDAFVVAAELRAYFAPPVYTLNPYLVFSPGIGYITKKQIGETRQGMHLIGQAVLGGGTELMLTEETGLNFGFQMIHYCNAGLADPNEGFELIVYSVGYLF